MTLVCFVRKKLYLKWRNNIMIIDTSKHLVCENRTLDKLCTYKIFTISVMIITKNYSKKKT